MLFNNMRRITANVKRITPSGAAVARQFSSSNLGMTSYKTAEIFLDLAGSPNIASLKNC
jgi:hypothetical protein